MLWNQCLVRITAGSLLSVCGMVVVLPKVTGYSTLDGTAPAQAMNERREAPAAAPQQKAPAGQRGLQNSPAPQTSTKAKPAPTAPPETTGQSSSEAAAVDTSPEEESKSAAEARRVRAAVGRTLDRTHELSRTASE